MKLARNFDFINAVSVISSIRYLTAHDNCIISLLAFLMADYDISSWIAVDSHEAAKCSERHATWLTAALTLPNTGNKEG